MNVMRKGKASWECEITEEAGPLWYVALEERGHTPFRNQRHVSAILDIDEHGELAGIELIEDMPLPPVKA